MAGTLQIKLSRDGSQHFATFASKRNNTADEHRHREAPKIHSSVHQEQFDVGKTVDVASEELEPRPNPPSANACPNCTSKTPPTTTPVHYGPDEKLFAHSAANTNGARSRHLNCRYVRELLTQVSRNRFCLFVGSEQVEEPNSNSRRLNGRCLSHCEYLRARRRPSVILWSARRV